jgi:hypothetical protein
MSANDGGHIPINIIRDKRFGIQLSELQKLKKFLFEERVPFDSEQTKAIDIGLLNNLQYRSWSKASRLPSESEWRLLDEKQSLMASCLNDDLRYKIRIRELNKYFYTIPVLLLSLSIVTIVYYFLYPQFVPFPSALATASFLGSVIVWTMSQGGLGACAFLGIKVAMKDPKSAREAELPEEQADITDKNVLKTRILLGCLFAFIFGLPLSLNGLEGIRHFLFPASAVLTSTSTDSAAVKTSDIVWIVAPFMLGFSIHLVLALLNRFVASMRTFFGIAGRQSSG